MSGMEVGPDEAAGLARQYRSPHRKRQAARTRAAVLDAGAQLFTERGWSGTAMREVARSAGVAVETVYAHFRSKSELLKSVLDMAIVGDDEQIPLTGRPEFGVLAQGELGARIAGAAQLVTAVNERTSGVLKALREAAASDQSLSMTLQEADESRRLNISQGARLVAGREPSRTEVDGLWAVLSVEVFQLLVERSGWSIAQYRAWVVDVIGRLLPA